MDASDHPTVQTLQALGPSPIRPQVADVTAERIPTEPSSIIGSVFADKYRLDEFLGEGATAWVFRAHHVTLGQDVAVKVLRPELSSQSDAVERFFDEARTVAELHHPHIVTVYDVGRSGPAVWMAMELLEGETLAERLGRVGRLSWSVTARVMAQLCAGLHAAHQRGVVHRDVKPDNCICFEDSSGQASLKLLDFGISARRRGDAVHSIGPGEIVAGTPAYMAPEAIHGDTDERSDVYSAGIVLYELLTGTTPYPDFPPWDSLVEGTLDVDAPSVRVPGCSWAELDAVVMRAIAPDPARRFASIREFGAAIEAADRSMRNASPEPRVCRPPSFEVRVHRRILPPEEPPTSVTDEPAPRRSRGRLVAAAAGFVLLVTGTRAWPEAPERPIARSAFDRLPQTTAAPTGAAGIDVALANATVGRALAPWRSECEPPSHGRDAAPPPPVARRLDVRSEDLATERLLREHSAS